MFSRTLIRSLI